MTSILFDINRIYRNQFKCNYLRKEKIVLNFLHHSLNFHKIFKIKKKKMINDPHSLWISEITDCERRG